MKRNRINEQFTARPIAMLESPAYRALSRSAHMVISRIEIELGHHAGNDNGRLPVTFEDFIAYGVRRPNVAPAIREAEALGFIRAERGRGGNAEYHTPSKFYLTFAHNRDSRAEPPTHDWKKIKSFEAAKQIARTARNRKDPNAVAGGKRRWHHRQQDKSRYSKPVPEPVPKTDIGNGKSPVLETGTTELVSKPIPLSISGGGGPNAATTTTIDQSSR
jgi:hypothetical protein